ncbi:MAG TPA: protein kinase [Bryobacteraceae bacterium]|nr:protein kinase [Bryobacteraceae bacterium]
MRLAAEPVTPEPDGDSFGNYEVICEIGEGGMGVVYLAEQTQPIRREVALKVLKVGMDTRAILRRFEAERQALARMYHAGIATIYDAGTSAKGRPYFAMEFVDGVPLTTACDLRGCTVAERIALFRDMCLAVDHAHRRGIVHRDLKPSNILLTEIDGRPATKVIDFGIAKWAAERLPGQTQETAVGEVLGTPGYMSPEQAAFDQRDIGPASDIYSLGIVLYELLAGVLPGKDDPPPSTKLRQSTAAAEIAGRRRTNSRTLIRVLSGDLERVIGACLQIEPAQRYRSAAELGADLDRYLRGEPVLAPGAQRFKRAWRWLRRHRGSALLAAAACAAVAAAIWIPRQGERTLLEAIPITSYPGAEASPSFSPDAMSVAFAWNGEREDNWDIYRLRIGDTAPQRLTSGVEAEYAPAWSPDGNWIAYLSAGDGQTRVKIIPAAGGSPRVILTTQINLQPRKRWLAWSRDGRWLLLAHRTPSTPHARIFAISASSGEEHQVTGLRDVSSTDGQPAISPDGGTLVFARDAATPGQIWTVPLSGDMRPGGEERRVPIPGFEGVECSVPTPLSSHEMLMLAPLRWVRVMWRASLNGRGSPRQLVELGSNASAPEVSRDGKKLVYAREGYDTNVWRLDLDQPGGKETARRKVLGSTLWDQNAALSPDDSRLAFESNRAGSPEIWVADAGGTNARQLSSLKDLTASPQWSPDGLRIVFSGNAGGLTDVYVVQAEGGSSVRLTHDGRENLQPVWSPDGKWIYYSSMRSGERQLWRIPATGGESVLITREGGFDVAFSPDGRWLYYSRVRGPSADIWRMPAEGGGEIKMIDNAIQGHVFATSRGLYFSQRSPGSKICRIQFLDLASGRVRTLATTDHLIQNRIVVTRDERSIYYTQLDDDGMDLMLVSDFR